MVVHHSSQQFTIKTIKYHEQTENQKVRLIDHIKDIRFLTRLASEAKAIHDKADAKIKQK